MPLRALASAVLLPPTSLALIALLALLFQRWWPRSARCVLWFTIVGLVVLAMPITGATLLVALEQDLPLVPPKDSPPQAIVVLGGDIERDAAMPPQFYVGPMSLERLAAAAVLHRRTNLPILVTGGSLRSDERPIATVMAESLQQVFQIPVRWTEPVSTNTWQNAEMSAAILRRDGISSVYVVTQAWHMRRALVAFQHAGLTATAAPTRMDHVPLPEALDFVPDLVGWQTNYTAIHEWLGYALYTLRGG